MKEINLEIEDMEEFPEDAKFVITGVMTYQRIQW